MVTEPTTVEFHVADRGGTASVVTLLGVLDRANVSRVAELFGSVFLVGYREVVVDLRDAVLAASGARLLAAFAQMLQDDGGRLTFRSVSPDATRLLRAADLGHLVPS